jgi:hypothetical protein
VSGGAIWGVWCQPKENEDGEATWLYRGRDPMSFESEDSALAEAGWWRRQNRAWTYEPRPLSGEPLQSVFQVVRQPTAVTLERKNFKKDHPLSGPELVQRWFVTFDFGGTEKKLVVSEEVARWLSGEE